MISTGHGGDYPLQSLLVTACVEAGIPRFMPAEFGHDSLNPAVQKLLPPYAERARLIDFLKDTQGSIEWVGLATGCDISRRAVDGNMGIDLAWQSATVFGSGDEQLAASTPVFVGETVRAIVVDHWSELRNQYVCLPELTTTYHEIVKALEKEMDCKFEIGHVEKEEGVK